MKPLDKKTKYILIIGMYGMLAFLPHKKEENNYPIEYELLGEADDAYAIIPNGKIYIGNEDYINYLDGNENNILIVDERDEKKNIKIVSSYRIMDRQTQNNVLAVISEYEKNNPSVWDRTTDSMLIEWRVHNMLYHINFKTSSTKDVDFENNEEILYSNNLFKKIFK